MTDQEQSGPVGTPETGGTESRPRISGAVRTETLYILCVTGILSLLMQSVFLLLGYWGLTVLWGNLLGASAAVGNFFFMALTVQRAVERSEQGGKALMRTSLTVRMFCLFVILMIGALLGCFHTIAVLIPMLFPRIAIALEPWIRRRGGKTDGTKPEESGPSGAAAPEESGREEEPRDP